MKNSRRFILFLLISVSAAQAQLIQKKYPGIQGKSSELLFINNESAKIIPHGSYDLFLAKQAGVANKEAKYIVEGGEQIATYPYIIVPESEYHTYMKKNVGFTNKPANHISINGKETIVLSSREINTNMSLYPGIVNKPAEHVYIDGQEVVFIQEEKYLGFISQYPGVPELPANYVYIDKKIVVVVPINKEDVKDSYGYPVRVDINDTSKNQMKELPKNSPSIEKSKKSSRSK